MKKAIMVVALVLMASTVQAYVWDTPSQPQPGTVYTQVGGTTYGTDGSTATRIGDTTFINTPNQPSVTCTDIGGTVFCN